MIQYGAWQIGFFNAGIPIQKKDVFGCSTFGAATGRQYHMVANTGLFEWGEPVRGCVFAGTYESVLHGVEHCAFRPSFMLVFFARSQGVEGFLEKLNAAMPGAPVVGGVAARAPGCDRGDLSPNAEDVVLLMCESALFITDTRNVLEARGGIYEFDAESDRLLKRMREPDMPWEDAARVVARLKENYRVDAADFESFAFSDYDGRNIKLKPCDGETGAMETESNLPKQGYLHLRVSERDVAVREMIDYAQVRHALVIGDESLIRLHSKPFAAAEGATMIFLPGQIVGGVHRNLMLTSIR